MNSRNKLTYLFIVTLSLIGINLSWAYTSTGQSKAMTAEQRSGLNPNQALKLLKEGNQRFLDNEMRRYDFAKEMKITTKKGQHPLAVILSCIDSRSIPEFLFDQGLGSLFVSRIAGNVADQNILGSMEFAAKVAGVKVILVMGHTHCGAIQGACQMAGETGLKNLDKLLMEIKPAVSKIRKDTNKINCGDSSIVNTIAKQNVLDQLSYIRANSSAINKLVESNAVLLVGAMHDIRTGNVDFFDAQGQSL